MELFLKNVGDRILNFGSLPQVQLWGGLKLQVPGDADTTRPPLTQAKAVIRIVKCGARTDPPPTSGSHCGQRCVVSVCPHPARGEPSALTLPVSSSRNRLSDPPSSAQIKCQNGDLPDSVERNLPDRFLARRRHG